MEAEPMTLYPCPRCGQEPEVARIEADGVPLWRAVCWCTFAIGMSEDDLERRWNGLYCANDPADGRDCL